MYKPFTLWLLALMLPVQAATPYSLEQCQQINDDAFLFGIRHGFCLPQKALPPLINQLNDLWQNHQCARFAHALNRSDDNVTIQITRQQIEQNPQTFCAEYPNELKRLQQQYQ